MALERRSSSKTIYLQAKHYCLWQELKKPVEGCETVEVKNPKTGATLKKHGYAYNSVNARVTKIVKYDTERKYDTRYFGFKMYLHDGADSYVLDMPYYSQILRRFLRVAPSVDWTLPLSITVFKGKKQDGKEELAVWFRQSGETVKMYFTKDHMNGMPEATQDSVTGEWDFKPQHRFLVQDLLQRTIPNIELAAARVAPPMERAEEPEEHGEHDEQPDGIDPHAGLGIDDSDVPF